MTKESARQILIAHLDDEKAPEGGLKTDNSWKVACGANVAYDQFPSQNQIFYESANGSSMWYDPVFRVETLDGRNVWCKVRQCFSRHTEYSTVSPYIAPCVLKHTKCNL